ncbi:MAG: carboxypeptidase-like regulatory domain-containing protein [Isosphaeraceae bacterium]|nr:carboxypeptidase-like regulatory domain-containing protein [Isosphaeraceae bacterium]
MFKVNDRNLLTFFCGAFLVSLSGCGADDGGVKKVTVYPVKGSVVLADGKPLSGGKVYFVPKDGALTSEGKIGSDGTFALVTGGSGEGAPPGDYKVRVAPEDTSLLAGKKAAKGKALPFPSKYLDEDSSGLTATVKADPNQLEPFRLK